MSVSSKHPIATLSDTSRDLCRYFGRAKELPGVKELFESKKKEEDEDVATTAFYKKFTGQGPSYFGDLDEADGELLAFERKAEEEGVHSIQKHSISTYSLMQNMKKLAPPFERHLVWVKTRQCLRCDLGYQKNPRRQLPKRKPKASRRRRRDRQRTTMRTTRWTKIPNIL